MKTCEELAGIGLINLKNNNIIYTTPPKTLKHSTNLTSGEKPTTLYALVSTSGKKKASLKDTNATENNNNNDFQPM